MSRSGKTTFSERMRRYFEGRNGNDEFARFLIWSAMILLLASIIISAVWSGAIVSNILWILAFAVLAFGYFRILSKNIYARQAENEKYIAFKRKIFGDRASRARRSAERKQYKRFACPACKTKMRVPRGKGKVKITCKNCGNVFYTKT